MPAFATTGIAGLDAQLGGGVPRGSTILLLAEPSNAVPVFCTQFAGGGLEHGETVFYFELDRAAGGIRDGVLSFLTDPKKKRSELRIYDGYSTQFAKGLPSRAESPTAAVPLGRNDAQYRILQEVTQVGAQERYRVIVESLSSLVTEDNEKAVLEFFRQFVHANHEMGGVALVPVVKGLHSARFETHLRHLASGVMEIGMERKGFGIYPYLMVGKMLDHPDPVRLLLFKETEKGIWLESTKRVF